MTVLVVSLVVLAVVLWPRGRPVVRSASSRAGSAGGPDASGGPVYAASDGGARAFGRMRLLLGREVRFGRARRGWVADFAELAAVGLDAGLPSAEAARLACTVGEGASRREMGHLADRLAEVDARGDGVGSCLAEEARGDPDLRFLAAAWQLTDEFGIAAAPAARTSADVLRERAAADDRRTVLAAGPRASMWLLTVLPLSGPMVTVLLGLPVTDVYGGPAPLVAAAVGCLLTGVGWLWSRRLVRRALRPAEIG
ncbi:type II secretion system F family protein [Knoellia sp. LjRoot47]|uniref:type II secretion system F family protein n=1 Tax=Knoellia sp. LjRoot47 TaxID=3342330 RepID=UPI003ECCFDA0